MQKPLVSVIVPIYNAQNNIVRCVESIRRQTYENLEMRDALEGRRAHRFD